MSDWNQVPPQGQQPPPGYGQQPPPGYGQPPGAGQPPGGSGSPLSKLSSLTKQQQMMFGGGALVVVLALIVGYLVFSGPSTVSEKEFAAAACEVQKSWSEKGEELFDDNEDLLNDMYSDDLSKGDAEDAKELMVAFYALTEELADGMRDVVDSNVVDDDDGEDLREALLEAYDEADEKLDKARSDLDDIDVGSSGGVDDLVEFVQDQDDYEVDTDLSSRLSELANDIEDEMIDIDDDNCSSGLEP